jgi:hypothetical protein
MRLSSLPSDQCFRVPRTWLSTTSAGHRLFVRLATWKLYLYLFASVWRHFHRNRVVSCSRYIPVFCVVTFFSASRVLLIAAVMADQLAHKNRTSGP